MFARPGMAPVQQKQGAEGTRGSSSMNLRTGSPYGDPRANVDSLPSTLPPNLQKRLNPDKPDVKRYPTNIPSLDEFLGGGLPSGLSIAFGNAGSGKSLFARRVAMNTKGTVLYFTCERLNDAPSKADYPHVETVDYTRYRPKFDKAIQELFTFIKCMKPELVIIDSLTSFLGVSTKALAESDIRKGVWEIHLNSDGGCPIIGISEIRGSGFSRTTAGGEGVKHGCTALLQFYEHYLTNDRYASGFPGKGVGDVVYTIQAMKDKDGLANNRPCEVILDKNGYRIIDRRNGTMR